MNYNLIITEHAEELLDSLLFYLLNHLKNKQAASHMLDSLEHIYNRLEDNPYQFPESKDSYLKRLGYREAVLTTMNYVIVFRVEDNTVFIVGFFHQLENYRNKIE